MDAPMSARVVFEGVTYFVCEKRMSRGTSDGAQEKFDVGV